MTTACLEAPEKMDRLIPVDEVARLLGVSVRSVWRMASDGTIPPGRKLSTRTVRWRLRAIMDVIEGNPIDNN